MGVRDRAKLSRRANPFRTSYLRRKQDAADGDPIPRLRRRAKNLLWAEYFGQAAAPAIFLFVAYLTAALFGFANDWAFAACCLLALLSIALTLAKLNPPTGHAIDRRIETASGLKHRPLAMLEDEPEDDRPDGQALWAANRRRVLASLATARIGGPAPAAAAQDPWALRGLLLSLLLCGLIIAGPAAPGRLAGAFAWPSWPFAGPSVTAWITPPGFTGQPPQILQRGAPITAFAGSKITIIIAGPETAPAIRLADATIPSTPLSESSHRADATLTTSGALLVGPWWHRLARWRIDIVPPGAPVITFTGVDNIDANHIKLHWHVTDAYGLQTATATLKPEDYPNALAQHFDLPANTGDETAILDLATSPFHALQNNLTIEIRNIAGKTASSVWQGPIIFPGMSEKTATGLALDNLRQQIAIDPHNIRLAATAMKQLSEAPPSQITAAADLKLSVLTCAIWLQQTGPQAAIDRMMALIQEIEAGPGFGSAQALAAANQALTAALQRGLNGQMPDAATLQKLLQAMKDALSQHIAALQPSAQMPQGAQKLDMSALDQMAQKIAADEAAGHTEQAAQELQQLQKILSELAAAKPMTAAQMAAAAAAAQAGDAISQMTQGESALLNKTHQGQAQPGDQATLQAELSATSKALAKAGLNVPGLRPAGQAMGAAQKALNQQDGPGAESQENAAIQSLQQAAAALASSQQNGFGIGQNPGGMAGQGDAGPEGGLDEQTSPLQMNGAPNPARIIEQQIITHDAAPALPQATHQYYHRLLQDGAGQ
jgi:hypothetical protein